MECPRDCQYMHDGICRISAGSKILQCPHEDPSWRELIAKETAYERLLKKERERKRKTGKRNAFNR